MAALGIWTILIFIGLTVVLLAAVWPYEEESSPAKKPKPKRKKPIDPQLD